jgi:hypothetical protein
MSETPVLSVIQDNPNQDVIVCLESLLEDAKSGELQALSYVASWNDNSVNSGWAGLRRRNRVKIMGQLTQVLHDLAASDPEPS